jgi:peptide/nickel transport system substrate-binding protein
MGVWRAIPLIAWVTVAGCYAGGGDDRRFSAPPCQCAETDPDAGSGGDPVRAPRGGGGTVTIRIPREPPSLLSLVDPDPIVRAIVDHDVYEALVRVARDQRGLDPSLALSWAVSEDKLSYRFKLDPRARWHDGKPVTGDDIKFTLLKLGDPDSQVAHSDELENIGNVTVADPHAVTVTLDRPTPNLLHALSGVPILPAHIFGQTPLTRHAALRAPVGSGPFKFESWSPGRSISLVRHSGWRGDRPGVDRIVYRIVPDHQVAVDLLRRGDLDIVPGLPAGFSGKIAGTKRITYRRPVFQAWVYNSSRPVFASPKVRLALAHLIDRAAIRCSIYRCLADLVEDPWCGAATDPASAEPGLAFSPVRARQLLEQEGWVDRDRDGIRERGGARLSFELLLFDSGRALKRSAAVVQRDMARAGIEMRIASLGLTSYRNRLSARRFDAAVIEAGAGPRVDPSSLFHSRQIGLGSNLSGVADADLDQLLDDFRAAETEETRAGLKRRIRQRLGVLQPVTFTFRPVGTALLSSRVKSVPVRDGWFDERFIRLAPGPAGGGSK